MPSALSATDEEVYKSYPELQFYQEMPSGVKKKKKKSGAGDPVENSEIKLGKPRINIVVLIRSIALPVLEFRRRTLHFGHAPFGAVI